MREKIEHVVTIACLFVASILTLISIIIVSTEKTVQTNNLIDNGETSNTEVTNTDPPEYLIPDRNSDFLILVNADNPLDENNVFAVVSAYRRVPLLTADIKVEEITLTAVKEMFDAARSEGIESYIVTDGYRSFADQKKLYDEAPDKSFVQLPGCSEHQTGLAVDIGIKGVLKNDMEASLEGVWLAENSWRFGLILRYPKDKTEITGISFEPWHFRYVGLDNAEIMYKNKLCLEEYLLGEV